MAVRISGIIIAVSFVFALFSGNMTALSEAAVSGCSRAVTLTMSLIGMMCLWSGVMRCAEKLGFLDRLSAVMSPVLKPLFPEAWKSGRGIPEISAAITANILGVGNAATPLATAAMKSLSDGKSDTATDDMITFTVLGTAFPCLFLPPFFLVHLHFPEHPQNGKNGAQVIYDILCRTYNSRSACRLRTLLCIFTQGYARRIS